MARFHATTACAAGPERPAPAPGRAPREHRPPSPARAQKLLEHLARELQALAAERDSLREQIGEIGGLVDRTTTRNDELLEHVARLESAGLLKDARIRDLEAENLAIVEQSIGRARRLAELESTLEMLALADETPERPSPSS